MNTNPPSSRDWQNKMLGRYHLTRMLGRGGMGEVWLAEDTQLRRQVAIKLLPLVYAADSKYLQDFEHEAQAAAALEHPHILPIHDFGEQAMSDDETVTYLVTPYITGGSLLERMQTTQAYLSPAEVLHYLRQAAEAIDYAHSQNVLHRDIKPANMLLQQDWLFLADFGIAKMLTHATLRNRTNAGAGTPEYMAPEQIQGKAVPASDRYSFAITAYQLLTKRVPFKGDTLFNTLLKQMSEPPPPPREFNPAIPEGIEQALLQGLAKRPEERFASCLALVRALESGYGLLSTSSTTGDASILSGQSAPLSGQSMPHMTPSRPSSQPPHASGATPPLSAFATPDGAHTPETPQRITEPAFYAPTINASPQSLPHDAPTHISGQVQTQRVTPEVSHLPQPSQPPAPNGNLSRRSLLIGGGTVALIAIGGTTLYTLLHANTAIPHPTPPAKPVPGPQKLIPGVPQLSLTAHTKSVSAARWDPTGRYLATASEDSYVMLWDLASYLQKTATGIQALATPARSWKLASPILANGLCWSAAGRTLAVVTGESMVSLINVFDNNDTPQLYQVANSSLAAPAFTAVAWSTTANNFATTSYAPQQTQQQVDLWQLNHTGGPTKTLHSDTTGVARTAIIDAMHPYNSPAIVDALSWSLDGTLLAGHTNFGLVTLWQTATGSVQHELKLPARPTKDKPLYVLSEQLAWSPVDAHLLAASNADVATIWDVSQNKLLLTLNVSDPVPSLTGLSWSSNGKYLAASYAGSYRIYVWDVATTINQSGGTQVQKLFFPPAGTHVHSETITDVAWSPDGRYIASASGDTTVVIWRVAG